VLANSGIGTLAARRDTFAPLDEAAGPTGRF